MGRKINSVKDYENAILEDEMKTGEYIKLLILRNNVVKSNKFRIRKKGSLMIDRYQT